MTDAPMTRPDQAPAEVDHIDAIAIGIESLGFNIGASFERRAKASFIEQALKLSGFQITAAPSPAPQGGGDVNAGMLAALKSAETWLSGWASAEPYIGHIRTAIANAECALATPGSGGKGGEYPGREWLSGFENYVLQEWRANRLRLFEIDALDRFFHSAAGRPLRPETGDTSHVSDDAK